MFSTWLCGLLLFHTTSNNDSVGSVLPVSREWTREGRVVVVPIKFIVGVRHALITPQSYDVRVHVYTYFKVVVA